MEKQNLPETLSIDTLKNMREVLNMYYDTARLRCDNNTAIMYAVNRLKTDIEEFTTNWEFAKQ